MLNDIAWLQFIGGLALIMPMFVVAAVVASKDKSDNPTFPRWFGYQSIMTFLLFLVPHGGQHLVGCGLQLRVRGRGLRVDRLHCQDREGDDPDEEGDHR